MGLANTNTDTFSKPIILPISIYMYQLPIKNTHSFNLSDMWPITGILANIYGYFGGYPSIVSDINRI